MGYQTAFGALSVLAGFMLTACTHGTPPPGHVARSTPGLGGHSFDIPIVPVKMNVSSTTSAAMLELRANGEVYFQKDGAPPRLVSKLEGSTMLTAGGEKVVQVTGDGEVTEYCPGRLPRRVGRFLDSDKYETSGSEKLTWLEDDGTIMERRAAGLSPPLRGMFHTFNPKGKRAAIMLVILTGSCTVVTFSSAKEGGAGTAIPSVGTVP